jgi:hypothetical protein
MLRCLLTTALLISITALGPNAVAKPVVEGILLPIPKRYRSAVRKPPRLKRSLPRLDNRLPRLANNGLRRLETRLPRLSTRLPRLKHSLPRLARSLPRLARSLPRLSKRLRVADSTISLSSPASSASRTRAPGVPLPRRATNAPSWRTARPRSTHGTDIAASSPCFPPRPAASP